MFALDDPGPQNPQPTNLSAYEVVSLWGDGEFVVSRATRPGEPSLLLLAPGTSDYGARDQSRLQRALSLREELHPQWAARPNALVEYLGRPTLLSEDPGGVLLAQQIGEPWAVRRFLQVGIGIAAALRQLHARGVIHKDLKPANLLIDASEGVWLTGFGFATRMRRERPLPEPPEFIAGTLAYMAPEQTGRMNRSIDSRSDLYALGVVFYEMLAGALPFTASDPMEWVHCHIARQPRSLHTRVTGIPEQISVIVLKLLEKNAEDRYQTARGVERDLERALLHFESTGRIQAFPSGTDDASDRLVVPEKLYGREAEIHVLFSSLERVVAGGETQLVLVSGYSGIGKSSVVNELHKVLVAPRGLFAAGKFDQYKRDIPYATLAQAFQQLIRQVLSSNAAQLAGWREQFSQALGGNGQLIANLVPELELVIGKQPAVADLPPQAAQGRFQSIVRRFLMVFARAEHPLALFLDDLQWLDAATLELLEYLLGDPEMRHLLLVGAYRDNEVGPTHPLTYTLEKLRRGSDRVREIVLAPLRIQDVAELCSDALHVDAQAARPLAELVHDKTDGNPFFAIQFIGALVDEGLLTFDSGSAAWQWEIDAIRAKGFTDNVVELMARKLQPLPEAAKRALRQLACLGNYARSSVSSLVYGVSEESLHLALQDVVQAGLVLRERTGYAFLHDRVHEAAYSLIPVAERAAEHLRIGRILAASMAPDEIEENIFEIVNHMNLGAALIESQDERDYTAELDRVAAQRAKASTAHVAAHAYAATGRSLLGADSWQRHFRLTFELELMLADCEFVMADLQRAEARLYELGARATSLTDRAAVISVQMNLYIAMIDQADHAVQICLDYLRLVGIYWSPHPNRTAIQEEYERLLSRIGGRSMDELLSLPLSEDPDHTATIEVLLGMFTVAFNSDRGLMDLVLLRMANLGLQHGNTQAMPFGYAFVGMVLGSSFGDYRTGFLFGKLARDLVEQRGLARYGGRIYHTLATHVLSWTQPVRVAIASIERGLQIMLDVGDVAYVSFGYLVQITLLLASCEPLDRVQVEAERSLGLVQQGKFDIAIDGIVGQLRLIRALRGELADPCTLDAGLGFVADYARLGLTRGWYWLRTMQACFIFGDRAAALTALYNTEPYVAYFSSFFELPEYHFYAALTLAACFDEAAPEARASYREALGVHQQLMAGWAENCQENYGNRLALMSAEIARVDGRALEAMAGYEKSIRMAREQGFIDVEAVACEVAARFYAARDLELAAQAFLQHARSGYRRWGAIGKVRQLDRQRLPLPAETSVARPSSAIDAPSAALDLEAVVKTSQAVTAEIGLEKLIETLMVIALEHAGAERGLLILPRSGELYIEAEASTDDESGVAVRLVRRIARHPELPEAVVHYVSRTQELVLLDDAQGAHAFSSDAYFREQGSRSVVCVPLVKQAELVGLLYLENRLTPHVFTNARIAVLKLLASQAATSLQNASLEEENASLAEKESLLKEVHHRVKNNLQLIGSMLSLQASRIKDPAVAELFADSRNRVRSMALVHENLYRAGNFSKIPMAGHIRALCAELTRAYLTPGRPVELVVRVGDVHLDMNRAVACGLIINELLSNALKHAFLPAKAGRIQIDFELSNGRYGLRVQDDGSGLPEGFDFGRTDSLGLQLVGDLTRQLRGSIAVSRGCGTTFSIEFDEALRSRRN
jgi:predicted ATPase/two-component sensor histidine kinase